MTTKAKQTLLKVIMTCVGILAGLVTAGFLPKINEIATKGDIKELQTQVDEVKLSHAEIIGRLDEIKRMMEKDEQ